MLLSDNSKIYGIPDGVYSGQNDRIDELNARRQSRQFPDQPLQPEFDPRPVSTKYSLFPMIDRRVPVNYANPLVEIPNKVAIPNKVENVQNHIYSISTNFSPATRNGPVSGYL